MAMLLRKMHLKWKPLFSLHSRIKNDKLLLACLCQRKFSTQVTIATISSSMFVLPKCTFSALSQNKICVVKKTKTCVMNPTLRYINSGPTSTINSTVFCDENKARAIRFMLSIKPSTTARRMLKEGTTPKTAGVCVPLCTINGIPSVLFTLRSKHMSSHRGEVCFPGGLKEDGDNDVTETALREMKEEIGIDPEDVDVWGKLIPIPNRTGDAFATASVVFVKNVDIDKLNEQRNKSEVELVFTVPIAHLCDRSNNGYTRFDPPKSSKRAPYIMPVFKGSGFHIWGLTALFTDMTLRALLPKYHKSVYMLDL